MSRARRKRTLLAAYFVRGSSKAYNGLPMNETRTVTLDSRDEAVPLFGPRDSHLRMIRDALAVRLIARGDTLTIDGPAEAVGPAGTGKTYLAVAMAVSLLRQGAIRRIVLVRPAAEAGERLGFLPGDISAKVNPYLRPLFDALNDMMEPEQVKRYLENDVIEIAPLAYMRGRAQPVTSRVLTPDGFRPIGSVRVGDSVIGSDGRPTAVLGVFPQGRKD